MSTFKPLLAATCEDIATLRYPLMVSPKLDGIRCVMRGEKALTRNLKPIPNDFVRNWLEANVPVELDGELLLRDHKVPFNEVSSAIMSRDGEPDFVYRVFDHTFDTGEPFLDRYSWLTGIFKAGFRWPADRVYLVEHDWVDTPGTLQAIVAVHVAMGYEGSMVRSPEGIYKFGRSGVKEGILLKIKAFADEEATVCALTEAMHNTNVATTDNLGHTKRSSAKAGKIGKGMLGALVCMTEDGAEFEIGTGFTEQQRIDIWAEEELDVNGVAGIVGRKVKFKYQAPPGGRKPGESPRFPVFLGWRKD